MALPSNISDRTKRIMQLALAKEESDSDIDSNDSFAEKDNLAVSNHETSSEIDEGDRNGESFEEQEIYDHERTDEYQQPTIQQRTDVHVQSRECDQNEQEEEFSEEEDKSEQEDQFSEEEEDNEEIKYYGKKKCFVWNKKPVVTSNHPTQKNIIKVRCSKPDGPARLLGKNPTPRDLWDHFFTNDILQLIVTHTNSKLQEMRNKIKERDSPTYKDTDVKEINALLGVILLCSIFKSSRESLRSLFSTSITGRPIFRAFMTEKRCNILFRALRFDDSSTRKEREKINKAAAISEMLSIFVKNCQKNYALGAHATVDETLVPFRGRCGFRMYIPNKPAKYGIKIMTLVDAHTSYLYDCYIYTGKGSDGFTLTGPEKKLKIPSQAVIRLTKCISGTNRNITCDNWFSSIELASELLKNKLTMVGTLKKNKPQIPPEFLPQKNRPVNSVLYGFTKDITLVSYVTKPSKAVVLLSTMHHSEYTDVNNNKPEVVSFYNSTKGGVDTLDQKCSIYSANRRTRRWTLAIFYHLVAVASSNVHKLHCLYEDTKKTLRNEFIESIALSLANDYLKHRLDIPNLPQELKNIIQEAAGVKEKKIMSLPATDRLEKRKNCRFCPYQKNRMTAYKCIKCDTPTCLEHSKKVCDNCVKK